MPLPTLSPAQRAEIAKAAAEARALRDMALAELKVGKIGLADLFEADDPIMQHIEVGDALGAIIGTEEGVAKTIDAAGIPEDKRIADLSASQKACLLEAVDEPCCERGPR